MVIRLGKFDFNPKIEYVNSIFKSKAKLYIKALGNGIRLNNLNKLIKEEFEIEDDIKNILYAIIDCMIVTRLKDEYFIETTNVKINDVESDLLLRLITYGNLHHKGDSIIVDALKYAKSQM